ncbi:MAG: peptide deformylase [Candidatus Ozemobacteraceae bacterium]
MAIKTVLQLGNTRLYEHAEEVRKIHLPELRGIITDLHDTLMDFRKRYGAGRAIAAPQIGYMKRLIYMNIDKPVVIINPSFSQLSAEKIEVWDDCMCFPRLLVKVLRHQSCAVEYLDEMWARCELHFTGELSELIQHEYDHLDGVLAVSRAIDGKSFSFRSELEADQAGAKE